MPAINVVKQFKSETIYHVYNRGVNKRSIFKNSYDYEFMVSLLKRYLSLRKEKDSSGRFYPNFSKRLELLSFCLMKNHFHLLIYQNDKKAMTDFLHSFMTSYSLYFNKEYERVGPLFQGTYKASMIDNDQYMLHISRYIHLNPIEAGEDYEEYHYSSYRFIKRNVSTSWLKPARILNLFDDFNDYQKFTEDYLEKFYDNKANKRVLVEI